MRLTINLDTNALIDSLAFPTAVSGVAGLNVVTAKRGDTPPIEFIFGRPPGSAEDIDVTTAITSFKFGCKLSGDYGGDYVISNWDGSEFAWEKIDGSKFTDAVTTNASATLTSATATFTSADVGLAISGAGIPAETTILGVTNATTITLSANATASASGVTITITGRTTRYRVLPSLNTDEISDALVDGTIGETVADQTARYALTGKAVGYIVKQASDSTYWIVINASQLNNAAGWDHAPQLDSIDLLAEVEVRLADDSINSSLTFTFRIFNDVNKGTEGTPTDAGPDIGERIDVIDEIGRLVVVDAVFGLDGNGARQSLGRKYQSIVAAMTAASANDTVVILPGTYNERVLLKSVNLRFMPGAAIAYTGNAGPLFYDTGGAVTCIIEGGVFSTNGSSAGNNLDIFGLTNASTITAKFLSASANNSSGNASVMRTTAAATVKLQADLLEATYDVLLPGHAGTNYFVRTRRISHIGGTDSCIEHGDGTGVVYVDEMDTDAIAIEMVGGSLHVYGGRWTAQTGLFLDGGTLKVHDAHIDTSASGSGNPATIASGTLHIVRSILKAHSTRDSIESGGGSHTVICPGSYANKAVDGNITAHFLIEDANVG